MTHRLRYLVGRFRLSRGRRGTTKGRGPIPTYLIDSYSVRLWSSRPTTNLDPEVPVAGVYLFEGATYRGYVYFHPDGTPLSPPAIDAASGQVFLSFNLSQLGPVLQMLREEHPIYLYELGPDNVGLMTGQEPTGEEEGLGG